MADAIILRSGGAAALDDITANASDILAPKVGLNKDGDPITGTIPSMAAQTVTPSNKSQTVSTSGKYMTGNVTVNAVSNLTAANIKQGVTVGGVAGNFTSDANATAGQILSGRTAYVNGQKVAGTIVSKGAQTVTPTKSTQRVSVNGNYMTGDVTVNPIPSNYITTSDANAVASDIRQGITAYVRGVKVIGNVSDYDGTLTSLSSSNVLWEPTSKWLLVRVPNGIYRDASNYISQSVLASKIGLTASKILAQQEVAGITGTATSDANLSPSYLLTGQTAYAQGVKRVGTMKDNRYTETSAGSVGGYKYNVFSIGSVYIRDKGSLDKKTYASFDIPSGYYNGTTRLIFPQAEEMHITPTKSSQNNGSDKRTLYGPVTVNPISNTYKAKQYVDYCLANGDRSFNMPTYKGIHLNLRDKINTDNASVTVKFGGKFDNFLTNKENVALILRIYTNVNDSYMNMTDIHIAAGVNANGTTKVLNRVLIAGTSGGVIYNRMQYGLWNLGFGIDGDGHLAVDIYCVFQASSTPDAASIEPVIEVIWQEVYDAQKFY